MSWHNDAETKTAEQPTPATEPATEPETDPTEPGSSDGTAFVKGIEAVRLSHEARMAEQIGDQNEYNEKLRRTVNREAIPTLAEDEEGEAVGTQFEIDSPKTTTTTNNYYGERSKQDGEDKPKKRKRLGKLATLAIGAGLVATGVGGTVGVGMIIDAIRDKPDTPAIETPAEPKQKQKPGEVDRSRYSLDLGD